MLTNALQYYKAVADILCSGGVLVKRLAQISASSTARAVRKLVTDPFLPHSSSMVGLAPTFPSGRHYQLLRLAKEPITGSSVEGMSTVDPTTGSPPSRSTSVV